MANENTKLSFMSRKEIQFIGWIIGIVVAILIPFITYGNKIQAIEIDVTETKATDEQILEVLQELKIEQTKIQKDIEHIKESLNNK